MKKQNTPKLQSVIETALYVDDMERSVHFYQNIMLLEPIYHVKHLCAFSVGDKNVLLVFQRESVLQPIETEFGVLPSHNGIGPLHVAFAIQEEDLAAWEQRLSNHSVPIINQIKWPLGGTSLYFRDPDENLLELVTPGIWSIY